jgi:hypothetical protein
LDIIFAVKGSASHHVSVVDEVAGKWLSVKRSASDKHCVGNIALCFDGKRNSAGKVHNSPGKVEPARVFIAHRGPGAKDCWIELP